MATNPVLGRREIPGKERLQKALAAVVVTAIAVGGAWVLTGASAESPLEHLAGIAAMALVGLGAAAYLGLKKREAGRDKEDSRAIRQRIHDDRHGRSWIGRIGYGTRRLVFGVIVYAGVLIALAGVGLLAFQVFGYLKTGEWPSYSLLRIAWPHVEWLRKPGSWFGLHKIAYDFLNLVPASVALLVLGWLVAGFGSALRGRVRR